jgi:urease beta subunit
MNTENLTDTQIKRKATAMAKKWVKDMGYKDIQVYSVRGTFHANNCNNYLLSAKQIMEAATGLEFNFMTATMARLKPVNNINSHTLKTQ